ncbi:MAG: SDR family oxidoreductase [Lysobacterales bacterium]|nr:SDR family oxidoreductase [Xanthomonadales bacterium]MCB1610836.1 SDR family oxidoreductase [Xanthomonadales bacterium]MCP5476951.1 SDR family oxidoreductase [Rhodanobacteraceae bacterium]
MKFALITGASGGVARALASRLRESGWKLVLVSRDVTLLDPADGDVLVQADVSTPGGAEAAFALAAERAGIVPDALINCAGNTLIAPLGRVTAEALRGCMAANVDTAFFSVQAYTKALAAARKTGDIVLFSSVVAGLGVSNHAGIAMAKGAIEALVRSVAADFSHLGIRINAVAPGLMRSPMTERMLVNERSQQNIAAQYPLGHYGDAADGAAVAAWLLSSDARWITGEVIHMDGGFSAVRPLVRNAGA